jgi:hypothetical protein
VIPRAVASGTPTRAPLELGAPLAVVLLSLFVGATLVSRPTLALLPLVALGGVLLLVDGRARILFVLFGGMLVLQRPGELDMAKMAFFAGALVAFAGALMNVSRLRDTFAYRFARPLLAVSLAFTVLAALSLAVAYGNGIPLQAWLRDIAPYLLFASAPVFALDAQASFRLRTLVALLVVAGGLGAAAFTISWLDRRGIAQLPLSRVALASLYMPAALFAYAMSASLQAQARRARWLLISAAVLALLVMTGTRLSIALVLAPIVIAFGARRHLATRSLRLAFLAPLAVVATVLLTQVMAGAAGVDLAFVTERFTTITSASDVESDGSYRERVRQSRVAWDVFIAHPVGGAGPGTIFEWTTLDNLSVASPVIDTPVTFPAKFGAIGLLVVGFLILKYLAFLGDAARRGDRIVERLALAGYLAVAAALTLTSPPLEDKGFSFGLILLLAIMLSGPQNSKSVRPPTRAALSSKEGQR